MTNKLELRTEHDAVVLRELTLNDVPTYFDSISTNRANLDRLGNEIPKKYPDLDSARESFISPDDPNKIRLGVWAKDAFAGSTSLTPDGIDVEIGYWMDERCTERREIASFAVGALSNYGLSHYARVKASVTHGNTASTHVFDRSGYRYKTRQADELIYELYREHQDTLPVGILKRIASSGGSGIDSHTYDGTESGRERLIRSFSGKKNKKIQRQIEDAIDFIAANPKTDGSAILRGMSNATPTFNNSHVEMWRFKPSMARGFKFTGPELRDIRIIYTTLQSEVGTEVVAVSDIIKRGDLEKKYN